MIKRKMKRMYMVDVWEMIPQEYKPVVIIAMLLAIFGVVSYVLVEEMFWKQREILRRQCENE